MNKLLASSIVFAMFVVSPLCASGQTSVWNSMSLVGDWRSWEPIPANMSLISNNLWEGTFFIGPMPSSRYRFVANESWSARFWGESNQTVFTAPIEQYAEINPEIGDDILQTNIASGYYRFRFDDSTGWYRIELVQAVAANYGSMAAAGDCNGWSTTPNMTLISNYTWQTEIYVTPIVTNRFKFVAHNTWGLNWGENNQSIFYSPVTGTAEQNGGDICVYATSNGIYRLTFNDSTLWYSIEFVRPALASYSSMAVASSFNGWNTFPNMTLITDHIWQASFNFNEPGTPWFKFAANGGWDTSWGDTNQQLYEIPVMGIGEIVSGGGYDIQANIRFEGTYYFRFNDTNFYYEVVPDWILQTFDTWTKKNTYGFYTNDGWVVGNGRIYDNAGKPRYGLAVNLNYDTETGHYFRTPFISNGVSEYGFWYRNWWATATPISYEIQLSYDGINWITNDVLTNITTQTYIHYSKVLDEPRGVYIRLMHTGGRERLLIDDFDIHEAVADVNLSGVAISPSCPWSNDSVQVSALVVTNQLATNLVAETYYRVGTTGAFTSILMTGPTNYLSTTSNIPAQPVGSVVYYYVQASFEGVGASSPVFWPDTAPGTPASYVVQRNRQGSVWINEVNCTPGSMADEETNEYIEVCGVARTDIGDWAIELLDTNIAYRSYKIPNNTMLPNDTEGFGFWVLGDSNVPNVNMVFTNSASEFNNLAAAGVIKLKNEVGEVECIYTYGMPAPTGYTGATHIGWEGDPTGIDTALALAGTGGTRSAFAWSTNDSSSPGALNSSQQLVDGDTNPLPSLAEADIYNWDISHSNVRLSSSGTNGWNPRPLHSATITGDVTNWTPITNFESIYSNGTSTVTFTYSHTPTSVFFRLETRPTW